MKYHFKNNRSITSGLAAVFLCCLLAPIVLQTAAAVADEGVEDSEPDTIRFQDSVEFDPESPPVEVNVYRNIADTRRIWHVAVTSAADPDTAICFSTFPLEAGEDFYDYEFQYVETEEGKQLALLEVSPRRGEGPLDPPTYQLAFLLTPQDTQSGWTCNNIGRGQHTELDGGPNLALEEIDGEAKLTRYDVARQISFCGLRSDEEESFEAFDIATGRFLPGAQIDIDEEGAGQLSAELPDVPIIPPLTEGFYAWLTASSDIRGAPAGATVPRPRMLGNLDFSSVWIEGEPRLGTGEYVTAAINTAAHLRGLRVFPGHGASPEAFEAYARPTRLLIGLSDGYRYIVDLPELSYEDLIDGQGLYVELPEPVITRCVSVMILEATSGEGHPTGRDIAHSVAIAEITPFTVLDADSEQETASRIVTELGREPSQQRRDQIAQLGSLIPFPMLQAISGVLRESDEITRRRVVPFLGTVHHDDALPILSQHFLRISPQDADYLRTKRAIAAHRSHAAPTLLEILQQLDIDDRKYVDTVRSIGRIGTNEHLRQLIFELGEGGEFLRRERIRAISRGGVELVPPLLSFAGDRVDSDAGLDALTTLVMIGQRQLQDEPTELDDAEILGDIYRGSESRAHRIRVIEGIGYFSFHNSDELLGDEILVDDPDPLIRKFAAEALQRHAGTTARQALESALSDTSPDVRIAAIRSLNRRSDAEEAREAVIEYAVVETWPAGIHNAMNVLARSPHPEAQQTVSKVIHRDLSAPVTRTALRALRRNHKALPFDEIESLFAVDDAPASVLMQLVHMLGISSYDDAIPLLISIADRDYAPLQNRSDEQLRALSRRAYLALGTSRRDDARKFLLAATVDDERPNEDRSFALHGLGFFNDRSLIDELRELSPQIPRELRPRLSETLDMIQNRLAVDEAEDELHRILETIEELDDHEFDDDDGIEPPIDVDPPRSH